MRENPFPSKALVHGSMHEYAPTVSQNHEASPDQSRPAQNGMVQNEAFNSSDWGFNLTNELSHVLLKTLAEALHKGFHSVEQTLQISKPIGKNHIRLYIGQNQANTKTNDVPDNSFQAWFVNQVLKNGGACEGSKQEFTKMLRVAKSLAAEVGATLDFDITSSKIILKLPIGEARNTCRFGDPIIHYWKQLIHQNISNPSFGVNELAKLTNQSQSSLQRHIKQECGLSSAMFIQRIRLNAAKEMLLNPCNHLADIVSVCGFTSNSYFTQVFQREFHVSPKAFRDSATNYKKID